METKITKRKTKKEITEAVGYCPYCKKEIVGSTANQVLYNMDIHINAKHKQESKK